MTNKDVLEEIEQGIYVDAEELAGKISNVKVDVDIDHDSIKRLIEIAKEKTRLAEELEIQVKSLTARVESCRRVKAPKASGMKVDLIRTFKIGDTALYLKIEQRQEQKYKPCPNCKGVVPKQRKNYIHHCDVCHTYGDNHVGKVTDGYTWKTIYNTYNCKITAHRVIFFENSDGYYELFRDDRIIDRQYNRTQDHETTTMNNINKITASGEYQGSLYDSTSSYYNSNNHNLLLFKTKEEIDAYIKKYKKELAAEKRRQLKEKKREEAERKKQMKTGVKSSRW